METSLQISAFELDPFDTYTYLIVGSLSTVASGLLFLAHVRWPELRKPPGDLILMISLAEFLLSMHYLLSAINTSWITTGYLDDSLFCKANGYVAIAAAHSDLLYNLCFLIHMLLALKYAAKNSKFSARYLYHIFSLGLTAAALSKADLGRNPYGTCSSKVGPGTLYYGTAILVCSMILSVFVYLRTKIRLQMLGIKASELRRDFSNYQGSMVLVFIFTSLGIIAAFHGQHQAIRPPYTTAIDQYLPVDLQQLLVSICKLGNTAKVSMPTILFLVRLRDPILQSHVIKMIRNLRFCFLCKRKTDHQSQSTLQEEEILDLSLELEEITTLNSELWSTSNRSSRGLNSSILVVEKQSALKNELMTIGTEDNAWMDLLPTLVRRGLARTFLAAVAYFHPCSIRTTDTKVIEALQGLGDNLVSFKLREKEVGDQFGLTEGISDCTVTFYHTGQFDRLMAAHREKVDFRRSFNPRTNEEAIKSAGSKSGGSSGELFIASSDGKLLLKTINLEEFKVFQRIAEDYCRYLCKNKGSLISRIFCLLSIDIAGTGKTTYAIIMENLMPFGEIKPLQSYDLKGSTYLRQVLTESSQNQMADATRTLKDLDFVKIEKKIQFEHSGEKIKFMSTLEKDSQFFSTHGIIDYSLLLFVYDRHEIKTDPFIHPDNLHNTFTTPDKVLAVGIIDYFQLFTCSKWSERLLKKIKTCSPSLETSSQPPARYRERFLNFISSLLV